MKRFYKIISVLLCCIILFSFCACTDEQQPGGYKNLPQAPNVDFWDKPNNSSSSSTNNSWEVDLTPNVNVTIIGGGQKEDNIGSEIEDEVETWVDSAKTSWFKKSDQTFGDFYNSLSGEMQAEIDAGLVNAEKNRVKGILGKDITDKILAIEDITSPYFGDLDGVLKDLSEPQKKLASYFAHLNSISKSLPEQFNVVTGSPDASKDVVGRDAKLFNAVLNDPYGLNQHISNLTGEAKFDLLSDDVEKEASAHKQNAQAIQEETKAQQHLNGKAHLPLATIKRTSTYSSLIPKPAKEIKYKFARIGIKQVNIP